MGLVKRSDKVAFMEGAVPGTADRMKNFTALSGAKNPKEYTRQYVDEAFEATDVVGMSPSIEFAFDQTTGNAVHTALAAIIDGEKLGDDAIVSIIMVDMSVEGVPVGTYPATKRDFAVVPGADGDNMDAYTYAGEFKAKGARIPGTATTTDAWATCVFVAD